MSVNKFIALLQNYYCNQRLDFKGNTFFLYYITEYEIINIRVCNCLKYSRYMVLIFVFNLCFIFGHICLYYPFSNVYDKNLNNLCYFVIETINMPSGPGFDSRLYPRNVSGSIGSGTGSTQPCEDNLVTT